MWLVSGSFMCGERVEQRVQRWELFGGGARGEVDRDLALAEAELVLRDRLQLRDRRRIEPEAAADAEREALFVDHDARDAGLQREHAQARDLGQVLERFGQRSEAVAHAGDDFVDALERARRRELLVDGDLLRDLRDVVVGHERVELHVDHRFARVRWRPARPCARRSPRPAAARTFRSRPRR